MTTALHLARAAHPDDAADKEWQVLPLPPGVALRINFRRAAGLNESVLVHRQQPLRKHLKCRRNDAPRIKRWKCNR